MVLNYYASVCSGPLATPFDYVTKVQLFSESTKHFANYFR